jgi:tetratricopeptide (TPR) repeat protein
MSVKSLFSSRDVSEPLRRRFELAIAVAQERLVSTHVDHALTLIQLLGDQVPFENALGIYTRLLRLSDDEARVITTRALAILGERAARSDEWPELVTASEAREAAEGGGRSFLRNMRQRMRGRVKDDLRRWVEMIAARTEVALLETHVENALNFVELLEKEQPASEAIEMYLEALDVRDSIAEIAYYLALSKLADDKLPAVPGGGSAVDLAEARARRAGREAIESERA